MSQRTVLIGFALAAALASIPVAAGDEATDLGWLDEADQYEAIAYTEPTPEPHEHGWVLSVAYLLHAAPTGTITRPRTHDPPERRQTASRRHTRTEEAVVLGTAQLHRH